MSQRRPRISLVISTLERRAQLERALSSFMSQTMADFEVIIVDQNSEGYLDDIINRFAGGLQIHWIRTERGVSRGRNTGLRHARGEIVGFPDDDCWYDQEVCQRVLGYFMCMPRLQFLTGRTVDRDGNQSVSEFRARAGGIARRDVFRTGNTNAFFLKREAALSVGGFDEGIGPGVPNGPQSGEETDFMLRCIDRGFEMHYDPAFTVFHDQVATDRTEKTLRRTKDYSFGFGHLIRKHRFGLLYVSYRVTRSLAKAGIYAARLDFWNARLRLCWARGTLRGFFRGAAPHATRELLATSS